MPEFGAVLDGLVEFTQEKFVHAGDEVGGHVAFHRQRLRAGKGSGVGCEGAVEGEDRSKAERNYLNSCHSEPARNLKNLIRKEVRDSSQARNDIIHVCFNDGYTSFGTTNGLR